MNSLEDVKKPQWYNTTEIAKFMGIGKQSVQRLISQGALRAIDVSQGEGKAIWRVLPVDLQAYYDAIRNSGVPFKAVNEQDICRDPLDEKNGVQE